MTFYKTWKSDRFTKSYDIHIYIAGNYKMIKDIAGEYCQSNGYCFSLQKVDFVYTNKNPIKNYESFYKEEQGVKITLINYPRYPISNQAIDRIAETVACQIAESCNQGSYSIVFPEHTVFYTRRKSDDWQKKIYLVVLFSLLFLDN